MVVDGAEVGGVHDQVEIGVGPGLPADQRVDAQPPPSQAVAVTAASWSRTSTT